MLERPTNNPFDDLPRDVLNLICFLLRHQDCWELRQVNKKFYDAYPMYNLQWKKKFALGFPNAFRQMKVKSHVNWAGKYDSQLSRLINYKAPICSAMYSQILENPAAASEMLTFDYIKNYPQSLHQLLLEIGNQALLDRCYQLRRDNNEEGIIYAAIECRQPVEVILSLIPDNADTKKIHKNTLVQAFNEGYPDINKLWTALDKYQISKNDTTWLFGCAEIASRQGHRHVIEIILQDRFSEFFRFKNFSLRLLSTAIYNYQWDIAELLLERFSQIDHAALAEENQSAKETVLYVAASYGQLKIVQGLLVIGVDVNASCIKKEAPLHGAAKYGHLHVVRCLLDHKANVNAQNESGLTPLHLAVKHGYLDVVKCLVEQDADINACDQNKNTALHEAARAGHLNVTEYLLDHGASFDIYNEKGEKPLRTAWISRYMRTHDFLEKYIAEQSIFKSRHEKAIEQSDTVLEIKRI